MPCGRGLWPWQQFKESAMTTFLLQEEVVFLSLVIQALVFTGFISSRTVFCNLCVIKIFPPFVL